MRRSTRSSRRSWTSRCRAGARSRAVAAARCRQRSRTHQPGPARRASACLRVERVGRLRHRAPSDGIHQRLARREVRVESDAADARGAGDGAHGDARVLAEAVERGLNDGGDAALGVRPAAALREVVPGVLGRAALTARHANRRPAGRRIHKSRHRPSRRFRSSRLRLERRLPRSPRQESSQRNHVHRHRQRDRERGDEHKRQQAQRLDGLIAQEEPGEGGRDDGDDEVDEAERVEPDRLSATLPPGQSPSDEQRGYAGGGVA
jgi:hypothetical protein